MLRLGFIIACSTVLACTALPVRAATISAVSCSAIDVQAAINKAGTGDTVSVPSGSCSWGTSSVSIDNKNITVQGAGVDVTNITGTWVSGHAPFSIGLNGPSNSSRVSGITVTVPRGAAAVIVDGTGWRVDHMKMNSDPPGALCDAVWAYGGHVPNLPYGPTGLVDHVTFNDCRIIVFGWPDVAQNQAIQWTSPLGLGDGNAVYLEDSTINFSAPFDDLQDCNYGGRVVFRNNTTTGYGEIHAHSNQGWRACRRWEIYNNAVSTTGGFFTGIWPRGGTGVIFNNSLTGTYGNPIQIDNVRSGSDAMNRVPFGPCDGTSFADGNAGLANAPGWPCRDQIGWNTDTYGWTTPTGAPRQLHEPAYFWGNTRGGGLVTVAIAGTAYNPKAANYLAANRDYYQSATLTAQTSPVSPFNGTSGIGMGTLANRPATCTTYGDGSGAGVGYWVTDQGSWNTKLPANTSGQLYRCSSTNTWTFYYMPFTYPHPLQSAGGDAGTTSPTPTNLQVK